VDSSRGGQPEHTGAGAGGDVSEGASMAGADAGNSGGDDLGSCLRADGICATYVYRSMSPLPRDAQRDGAKGNCGGGATWLDAKRCPLESAVGYCESVAGGNAGFDMYYYAPQYTSAGMVLSLSCASMQGTWHAL
jgi:hypothetical protein